MSHQRAPETDQVRSRKNKTHEAASKSSTRGSLNAGEAYRIASRASNSALNPGLILKLQQAAGNRAIQQCWPSAR
jgi:hypothetical protein